MKNKPYSLLALFSLFLLVSQFCVAALPAPGILSPQYGNSIKTFEAKLLVSAVAGATGYQFQLDTTNYFNSIHQVKDTSSTTSLITPTLRRGKSYVWRARAYKPGDTSAWSGTSSFRVLSKLELLGPYANTGGPVVYLKCSTASLTPNVTYIFEVDTTINFSSAARVVKIQNTPEFADTSLFYFGNKLFWRATAVSSLGDTVDWSNANSYIITKRPFLSVQGTAIGPAFKMSWPTLGLADVSFQMDTTDSFSSGFLIEKMFAPGTQSDSVFNLLFGQKYFFRLRGIYGNAVSDWSFTQSVTIDSIGFISIATGDEAVYLGWKKLVGANTQLQFADDSLFTQLRIDTVFTGSQNSLTYNQFLGFSKSCFGRVRYFHAIDTTNWRVQKYTTPDGSFALQTPINRLLEVDVRPHFTFEKPSWTNQLVLEIDTGYTFGNTRSSYYIRIDSFGFENILTAFADTSLHYNQRYVWRVYGVKNADTGNITTEYTFVTKSILPVINYPSSVLGTGTNPFCRVTGIKGSSLIQWQMDTTNLFNSPQLATGFAPHIPDPAYPANIRFYMGKDQFFATRYFWRIRCLNPVDTGNWSLIANYTTTKPIKILSPNNHDTDLALPVILKWTIEGNIPDYWFQYRISTDSLLENAPIQTFVTGGEIAIQADCDYDTTYFWQVRALHSRDTSEWTPVYKFSTIMYVGLEEQTNGLETKVYPNPAQDRVTLLLNRPCRIMVYNAHGELVYEKNVAQPLQQIDTNEWAPGVYLMKMVSGERITTEKLMITH